MKRGNMIRFREYAQKRLNEENMGLDINSLRGMILKSLGGNPENKEAYNTPLVQFSEPAELISRLNSLKGLEQMLAQRPAAMAALEKAQQTNLTVGQLAMLLIQGQ
jgi:hypothetical protein